MSPVWNQPSTMESAVAGVVVVGGEDPDALEQNLAVPGDPDPEPGSGGPTVPILILSGVLAAIGAVVSSEAVALEDDHADATVEVPETGAEQRAAGDGVADGHAHRGAQAIDELVEDRVPSGAGGRDRRSRATRCRRPPPSLRGGRSCPSLRQRPWPPRS